MRTHSKATRRASGSGREAARPFNGITVSAELSLDDSRTALQAAQRAADEVPLHWLGWQIRLVDAVQLALRDRLVAASTHAGRPLVCPEFHLAPCAALPGPVHVSLDDRQAHDPSMNAFPPDHDDADFAESAAQIADEVPILNIPWEALVYRLVHQKLTERHAPHLN